MILMDLPLTEIETVTLDLLRILWRSVDSTFKSEQRVRIWNMFQSSITIAANQNATLITFVERVVKKLRASHGYDDESRTRLLKIVTSEQDNAILSQIRQQGAFYVAMLRAESVARRAEYEESQQEAML